MVIKVTKANNRASNKLHQQPLSLPRHQHQRPVVSLHPLALTLLQPRCANHQPHRQQLHQPHRQQLHQPHRQQLHQPLRRQLHLPQPQPPPPAQHRWHKPQPPVLVEAPDSLLKTRALFEIAQDGQEKPRKKKKPGLPHAGPAVQHDEMPAVALQPDQPPPPTLGPQTRAK